MRDLIERIKTFRKARIALSIFFLLILLTGVTISTYLLQTQRSFDQRNWAKENITSYPKSIQISECKVKRIDLLGWGGFVDWSHLNNLIVYSLKDEKGIYQLHTIKPDGSEDRCISCQEVSLGPSLDRHKGFASWHPSGKYLITQVERENHAGIQKFMTEPGRGQANNLWLVTPDGKEWYQLTDYSQKESGVLNPRFSHDGKKLFWTERIGKVSYPGIPMAQWQLAVADFVIDKSSRPRLENKKTPSPGNGNFYESQGFSPGDTKVIFTADVRTDPWGPDLFTMDFDHATNELSNLVDLTNTYKIWDEHAHFSPDGKKISYMSAQPFPGEFKTESFLMNSDGSDKHQLTHFNTPGYPEYTKGKSVAAINSWSPDGTHLEVEQILFGESYGGNRDRRMWVVIFEGACGNYIPSQPFPIVPTSHIIMTQCGNNICEPGENKKNCPKDCSSQPAVCKVKSIKKLAKGTRPDWSSDERLIAYEDMVNDNYEVFLMNADGANANCLTCGDKAPQELRGKHKGKATFHPGGKYLLISAENEFSDHGLNSISGIGDNHDFWAINLENNTYKRLTSLSKGAALQYPRFSADGNKLLYSERYEKGQIFKKGKEFGLWKIKMADFTFGQDGPQLTNITELEPGGKGFYEPHGFSPDGAKIIFTAAFEAGESQIYGDIYTYNLSTKELINLTKSDNIHDEQALYSPDGNKISFMSGSFIIGLSKLGYASDLYLMDADGKNRTRLTYFNQKGYPDYLGEGQIDKNAWSPDGTKIVSAYYTHAKKDHFVFLVNFEGVCGSQ